MSIWTIEDITDFVEHHKKELEKSNPELTTAQVVVKILQRLKQHKVELHFNGMPVRGVKEVDNTYHEDGTPVLHIIT